jgi:hypothetical protein
MLENMLGPARGRTAASRLRESDCAAWADEEYFS